MRRVTCFFTKISLIILILDCFSCFLAFCEEVAEQRHQNPKSDALSGVFDSPMEPQTEQRMFTRDELIALYRRRAKRYDLTANLYYLVGFREWAYRKKAVRSLELSPGDTVIEIGCGTGLNFELLHAAVGSEGRVIGVDLTDAMLQKAQSRIDREGWSNFELVQCDATTYQFPETASGIISTFALTLVPNFDVVIAGGVKALIPGAHWVVADLKMPSNIFRHLYPMLLPIFRPFGVTLDLQSRHPWESVEAHLGNVTIEEYFLGFTYIASGVKVGEKDSFPHFSISQHRTDTGKELPVVR